MPYFDHLTSPTLLLDPERCRRNLVRMQDKAERLGLKLVPHFKTPQSRVVAGWAKELGINELTVSSLKMATHLSTLGFNLIHIAFPFNLREMELFNTLQTYQPLSIQLVSVESTQKVAEHLSRSTPFFIEIDAGYGRTGVPHTDFETIDTIIRIARASGRLEFRGFYIHPGHTYYGNIAEIYEQTRQALSLLKSRYQSVFPNMSLRVGDTPGCSLMHDFGPATELGPGNFIFYDLMQVYIGSCTRNDIAIALAAPVVDVDHTSKRILIHGGGVHLSKDFLPHSDGSKSYGEAVLLTESGWEIPDSPSPLISVSQEHGVIQASPHLIDTLSIGDLVGVLPVHSCMTADCMRGYWSTKSGWMDHGEGSNS